VLSHLVPAPCQSRRSVRHPQLEEEPLMFGKKRKFQQLGLSKAAAKKAAKVAKKNGKKKS
jgi:hypothetical protein